MASSRSRLLSGLALLMAAAGTLQLCAFATGFCSATTRPPLSSQSGHVVVGAASNGLGARPSQASSASGALALGAVGTLVAASTMVARRGASAAFRARVAAKVVAGAPSLIQVLEQKKLLSFAEKNKLLSLAESSGVRADLPEKLGLLVLAEKLGLLSLAETIVTDPSTPGKLFGAGALTGVLAVVSVTQEELTFFNWFLTGAFGSIAVAALVAGLVISGLMAGVKRTKNLDIRENELVKFEYKEGFKAPVAQTVQGTRPVTLLNTLEDKQLLSFVENFEVLSLGQSFLGKPLTITQQLGVLSTLESTGILSEIETLATDDFVGLKALAAATPFLILAVIVAGNVDGALGLIGALLVSAPAIAIIVFGIVIGSLSGQKTAGNSKRGSEDFVKFSVSEQPL